MATVGTSFLKLNWTTTEQVHPTMTYKGSPVYYKILETGDAGPSASGTVSNAHGITNFERILPGSCMMAYHSSYGWVVWFSNNVSAVGDYVYYDATNANWNSSVNRAGWSDHDYFMIFSKTGD